MSEMVERVARTLSKRRTGLEADWTAYEKDARAAIEAMREPTKEMLAARYNGTGEDSYDLAEGAYRAMINAALGGHRP